MESRQITDRRPRLKLAEDVQNLLLRVPFAFHAPPSVLLDLQSDWHRNQGQGQYCHANPVAQGGASYAEIAGDLVHRVIWLRGELNSLAFEFGAVFPCDTSV